MLVNENKRNINNKKRLDVICFILTNVKKIGFVKKILFFYNEVISIRVGFYKDYKKEKNVIESKQNVENEVEQKEGWTGKNFWQGEVNKEVIELTRRFSKVLGRDMKCADIGVSISETDVELQKKYILYAKFILKHSKGDKLPKNSIVNDELDISDTYRKKLRDIAIEKGLVIKVNPRVCILNINYDEEDLENES